MNELRRCPFCGSAGKFLPADYVDINLQSLPVVECSNQDCGAWVPVASWNNRALDTQSKQFLSDVITAAGLVSCGKQDKKFAERLSKEAYGFMEERPK